MQAPVSGVSAFGRGQRFLLCDHCGAPVELQHGAPTTQCTYCRATLEVRMLPEAAEALISKTEGERIAILAAQDRRYLPPGQLVHLFIGERIAPSNQNEAQARWQQLRRQLRGASEPAAAEQFVTLTLGLAESAFERGDFLVQRAFLDSALAVASTPRLRQLLHASLARGAARFGTTGDAHAWLSSCNPRSEDLLADTAYRFARAHVATSEGDLRGVVATLGVMDFPASDAYAAECALLCANAWERMDQQAVAVDALLAAKQSLGPLSRGRMRRFIRANPQWALCPKSLRESEQRLSDLEETPIEAEGLVGLLLLVLSLYLLAWGASGLIIPALFVALGVPDAADGMFVFSVLLGGFAGALMLPFAVIALIAGRAKAKGKRTAPVCAAYVLEREELGTASGPESMDVRVRLLMLPDDAPAYHSTSEFSILRVMRGNFDPGKLLVARMSGGPSGYVLQVPP
ncbi:MAG: hypothetical protein R3B13_40840 [Polyangiaceae bacterium]